MEPEKDLDLQIADASEKILTFEKTLELTENHLSNLERKVQVGIQMLTKSLGKYNDLAQLIKNIQKYQTDPTRSAPRKFERNFYRRDYPPSYSKQSERS